MIRKIFVLVILVSHILVDACVTYNFEEDYDVLFASNTGICYSLRGWDIGYFGDTALSDHSELSTKFIYPQESLSCVTSFMFNVTNNGIIEVNTFMNAESSTDEIQALVMEYVHDGNDRLLGIATNNAAIASTFVPGWHTLTVPVIGTDADMTAYILIMGRAAATSTVLVDSFRYIPPGMDETECEIYETQSTPEVTTVPTTELTFETTTKLTEATTASIITTELPTTLPISDESDDTFWTPSRIKILIYVLIALIILILLSFACYCCCRSNVSVVVVRS